MNVPIKGQKHNTLHLIDEDLALQFLEAGEIKRFRLALASQARTMCSSFAKSQRKTSIIVGTFPIWRRARKPRRFGRKPPAEKAKAWRATKLRLPETLESFQPPNLADAIAWRTYRARLRRPHDRDGDHPALLRKIGAKQSLS